MITEQGRVVEFRFRAADLILHCCEIHGCVLELHLQLVPQAAPVTFSFVLYFTRKFYKKARASIITIQKNLRACLGRRKFERKRSATLVLQKHRRGQLARTRCRKLREEKRKREEEERKKREERRRGGER